MPRDKEKYKIWCEANKEKIAEQSRKRYEKRKNKVGYQEKKTAYRKQYRKDNPKKIKILAWKSIGMIDPDWDLVYKMFMAQTNCWICDRLFDDKYPRNLDHDHETGELRYVVCTPCNCHIIG